MIAESDDAAFEIDEGLSTDDATVRTMLYIAVIGAACCLVVLVAFFMNNLCAKMKASEIENENMVKSVEESHQITELDIEVSVDMERDRQEEEQEAMAITETGPAV